MTRLPNASRITLLLVLALAGTGCTATKGDPARPTANANGLDARPTSALASGLPSSTTTHDGKLGGEALTRAALAMERTGDRTRALALARRATERSPRDAEAWLTLARLERRTGDLDAAQQAYDRAARIDRSHGEVALGRAQVALLRGEHEKAITLFERARRQSPRDPRVWVGVGVANDALGRHARAQEMYRYALSIDPGNASAEANLRQSLAMAGETG